MSSSDIDPVEASLAPTGPHSPRILRALPDDHPLLARYRTLKDRELRAEGDRFIAEGRKLVERLIASPYEIESVLCGEQLEAELAPLVPSRVQLIIASRKQIDQIVGFTFHNGCLAVGIAPPLPDASTLIESDATPLIAIEQLNNTENLGAIMRIAAGFGAGGILLDARCADPFYRQAARVSMGAVFSLKLATSTDLPRDLKSLADRGYDVIATVTHPDAEPIQTAGAGPKRVIVLGSEAHGLSQEVISACNRKITIPMQLGTDSLNVSIATAIFMYHFSLNSR
jgi:tRNA G18 (ribose-2'-O)-methylase SpoU